jgi:hypothetical protein
MLTAFVVAQIVFDVIVVTLVVLYALDRRKDTASTPPDWYGEVVNLAQDMVAATEPVLDRLDQRRAPDAVAPVAVAPAPHTPDRYAGARTLLLAGVAPEEVAARERLTPSELKLLQNIVATQTRLAAGAPRG